MGFPVCERNHLSSSFHRAYHEAQFALTHYAGGDDAPASTSQDLDLQKGTCPVLCGTESWPWGFLHVIGFFIETNGAFFIASFTYN